MQVTCCKLQDWQPDLCSDCQRIKEPIINQKDPNSRCLTFLFYYAFRSHRHGWCVLPRCVVQGRIRLTETVQVHAIPYLRYLPYVACLPGSWTRKHDVHTPCLQAQSPDVVFEVYVFVFNNVTLTSRRGIAKSETESGWLT